MQPRGFTYWFRRNFSRLALMLGFFCALELFVHLTDGTNPNIRMPLETYPYFVAGLGAVSLLIGWLTYIPPYHADVRRTHEPPTQAPEDRR